MEEYFVVNFLLGTSMFISLAFSHLFVWEYQPCSSVFSFRWYFLNFWVLYFPFQSVFCLWLSSEYNSSKWIDYSRKNLFTMSMSQNGSHSLLHHVDFLFYVIIPSKSCYHSQDSYCTIFCITAVSLVISISFLQHFSIFSSKWYLVWWEFLQMKFLSNLLGTCNFNLSGHVQKLLSLSFILWPREYAIDLNL